MKERVDLDWMNMMDENNTNIDRDQYIFLKQTTNTNRCHARKVFYLDWFFASKAIDFKTYE